MRRFLHSFRRLRWKLTASYTLVTVTTLLVLQLAFIGVAALALLELGDRMPRTIVERMSGELAPQAGSYLQADASDHAGIHGWLQEARRSEITTARGVTGIRLDLVDPDDARTRLLIVDTERRLLGDSRRETPPATRLLLDSADAHRLEGVLTAALSGGSGGGSLWRLSESGWLSFAVPVRDETGNVVGALALSGPTTPVAAVVGIGSVSVVAVSVLGFILFTIAAIVIGTVLGSFTARGLTRRLDRVTFAATAWGRGDFSRTIADHSGDELGQMGRRLDDMAADLENLFRVRQQLSAAEERNRLARDLHDSVKQQVFATSMNLAAARALWEQDPIAARSKLDAAADLVRLSQQELTGVIRTLRPVQVEAQGLCQALADHVARWREHTGIAASFEARGEGNLSPAVEDALFRVAQEALANVARHSHASAARVTATLGRDEASLAVEDNGDGFAGRGRPGGVGLDSMRERVEALNGAFQVKSGPEGTMVMARIPAHGGRG